MSNDNEQSLEMPPKSQHERDTASWWARQIWTMLLFANAGGAVAVAGFAGNAESIRLAGFISYPSLKFFLIGAISSTVGLFAMFLYSSWRLEEWAEINRRRLAAKKNGASSKPENVAAVIAFFTLLMLMLASFCAGSIYFVRGVRQSSFSTAALSCAVLKSRCDKSVFPFGSIPGEILEAARKVETPGNVSKPPRISVQALPPESDAEFDYIARFWLSEAAEYALRLRRDCMRVRLVQFYDQSSASDAISILCAAEDGKSVEVRTSVSEVRTALLGR